MCDTRAAFSIVYDRDLFEKGSEFLPIAGALSNIRKDLMVLLTENRHIGSIFRLKHKLSL